MTWYESSSLVISALNLCVLGWTLRTLRGYARDTTTLARCAVEQMPRPCVGVLQVRDVSDRSVLESASVSIDGLSTICLQNIGTAHAINVRFWVGAPGHGAKGRDFTSGPTIECGDRFDTGHPRNALGDPAVVVIEYESVTGKTYRSETTIEGRRWVKSARFWAA